MRLPYHGHVFASVLLISLSTMAVLVNCATTERNPDGRGDDEPGGAASEAEHHEASTSPAPSGPPAGSDVEYREAKVIDLGLDGDYREHIEMAESAEESEPSAAEGKPCTKSADCGGGTKKCRSSRCQPALPTFDSSDAGTGPTDPN